MTATYLPSRPLPDPLPFYRPTKDEPILHSFRNSYKRLRDLREQARKAGLDAWETLISVIAQAMKYQFGEDYPLLRTTAFQALPDSVRQIPYEHAQRTTLLFSGLLVDSVREGAAKNVNPLLARHIIMSTINSARSEERRVGKKGVSQCRYRWSR